MVDDVTPNMAPDLFTTFERLEVTHRVKVTEENINDIARAFGWSVSYASPKGPYLWNNSRAIEIGTWVDQRGSAWDDESMERWAPAGTYVDMGQRDV